MIVLGTAAVYVSAYVTQVYALYSNNDLANSIITICMGYAVSIPLFAVLFHHDNKLDIGYNYSTHIVDHWASSFNYLYFKSLSIVK